jgi:hypothetical protein
MSEAQELTMIEIMSVDFDLVVCTECQRRELEDTK